ncbi:MAG: hypothetical protein Q4D87_09035 [Actinomycetaceae bacterium]|nr:hypothetical protein [Actinomycetaceae bacterium]
MRPFTKPTENPLAVFWSYVHEPKAITVTMSLAYVVTLVAGVWTISTGYLEPVEIMRYIAIVQGVVLIMGGTVGALSSLIGYYALERPAVMLTAVGIAIWVINTWTISPNAGLIGVFALLFLVTRWLRIRVFTVTPGEPVIHAPRLTK